MHRRTSVIWRSLLFTAFGALTAAYGYAVDPPGDLTLELFAEGFTRPVAVRHAGDGSNRLFVVEQAGRIWVVIARPHWAASRSRPCSWRPSDRRPSQAVASRRAVL